MNVGPLTFSVIIPNLHSVFIEQTLNSLRKQTYDLTNVEVVVVGQDRHNLVQEDALVRFDRSARPLSPAKARNRGMAQAQGDVFAFIDADCLAAPSWLATLAVYYQVHKAYVVGGGVDFPKCPYLALCDNLSWFYEVLSTSTCGTRDYLPTLNFSLRREVVDDVGGIDEGFLRPAGEDTEWTTRMRLAGYTLHFEPRAVVYHHHPRYKLHALFEHAYRFGYNSVKVSPRYADVLHSPIFFRNPLLLSLLIPFLAFGATLKVMAAAPRYASTLPIVYLTKLAWGAGAIQRLRVEKVR